MQIDQMNRLQKDLDESGLLAQSSMSAELNLALSKGKKILSFPLIRNIFKRFVFNDFSYSA